MIAVLLTIHNAAMAVYSVVAILRVWSEDIWHCLLLVFLAAFGSLSLANVSLQAVLELDASLGVRSTELWHNAARIRAESRGDWNV
jgi:hypothetical protein